MIVLGVVFLLVGYLVPIPILTTIGLVLLLVGAVLWVTASAGHPIAGRRYWF